MNLGTLTAKLDKTQYSEPEVAQELGISVEQLRALIRSVAEAGEEQDHAPMVSFQPADLLVLKLLLSGKANPTTQD